MTDEPTPPASSEASPSDLSEIYRHLPSVHQLVEDVLADAKAEGRCR